MAGDRKLSVNSMLVQTGYSRHANVQCQDWTKTTHRGKGTVVSCDGALDQLSPDEHARHTNFVDSSTVRLVAP